MKEQGVIVTRKNKNLNFGQVVEILSFNEFADTLIIKPQGDSKKYIVHYKEVWPSSDSHNYEELNKRLEELGEWDYLKK